MVSAQRSHGGPDAEGVPLHDFSTNANACGPCPEALAAVRAADLVRYPDPGYTALRARLAAFHGVAQERIVPVASGSEGIFRLSAWAARTGLHRVALPAHAYGDYAAAALAHGLTQVPREAADLVWACEPSSPRGQHDAALHGAALHGAAGGVQARTLALDLAYEPLRLQGDPSLGAAQRECVWQLWTPNKALGLTGVRAAYLIAPRDAGEAASALGALAPSWVLGADGVALLEAWCTPQVQQWLARSLDILRTWKDQQMRMLHTLGWQIEPSDTPFFIGRPGSDAQALAALLAQLRRHGIKLRDCTSFGLPGWLRLSVQPPQAQQALRLALEAAP